MTTLTCTREPIRHDTPARQDALRVALILALFIASCHALIALEFGPSEAPARTAPIWFGNVALSAR